MRRGTMLAAAAVALAAGWALADEPARKPTDKEIKEQMVRTHKGKDAPLARAGAELKKDAPDWDQLAKDAKAFADMGEALKGRSAYTSPAKYVASAGAFEKAVKEKDRTAASTAYTGLTKSCTSCHY